MPPLVTRLVVTGTRYGRADLGDVLDAYLAAFGVPQLILGGDWVRTPVRPPYALLDAGEGRFSRAARGVDLQAFQWALRAGVRGRLVCADWYSMGEGAGPERNGRMVSHAGPGAHLLAFPGPDSRGTWECFKRGKRAGLHCVVAGSGWLEELRAMAA